MSVAKYVQCCVLDMASMRNAGDMDRLIERTHAHIIQSNIFLLVTLVVDHIGLQIAIYWFEARIRSENILLQSERIYGATRTSVKNIQWPRVVISKRGNISGEL